MSYQDLLERKQIRFKSKGVSVDDASLNTMLKDFQRFTVTKTLERGCGAVFQDTGLGKGFQQLEWANQVVNATGDRVLILAPLAVANQFLREADKFDIRLNFADDESSLKDGVNVTNYQKLHKFSPDSFAGIALDEASILKNSKGVTFDAVCSFAQRIPFKTSWTATPAPNDYMEFASQAEFLGVMRRDEVLSTFFRHDGGENDKWVLSGHGEDVFWQWLASWSIALKTPSDLGFSDDGYVLPELVDHHHIVDSYLEPEEGALFATVRGLSDRRRARKASIEERCQRAAELIKQSDEQWLIWCEYDAEQQLLEELLGDSALSIWGKTPDDKKLKFEEDWRLGKKPNLITKIKIFGSGMNWQHCHNCAYVGISDSWEGLYQSTKRLHRFGQRHVVNRHLFFSRAEDVVFQNLLRKASQADKFWLRMRSFMQTEYLEQDARDGAYTPTVKMAIPSWLAA